MDWIHHILIDLSIDSQLVGTILRIHLIMVKILRLVGLVERFLVILVLLRMVLLGTDNT